MTWSDFTFAGATAPKGVSALLAFLSVFALSASLTAAMRGISQKIGFVSRPKRPTETRWNSRPVALGGGIAINLSCLIAILMIGGPLALSLAPAVLLIFLLGLVDDIWGVPPPVKLLGQAIAAAFVTQAGYLLPFPWIVVSIALTIAWIVGMSNSVNLLDNMDGLAAGVAMIAALGISFVLLSAGSHGTSDMPHVLLGMTLAGACAGFLVHNFNPARIFMGDAGSLPIGFLLAVLATRIRVPDLFPDATVWILAVLILVVPLLDTALVMVARGNARRPLMVGGRDHSSHRLVQIGLSERKAVLVLYLIGFLGAGLAWLICKNGLSLLVCSAAFLILVTLFGIFLLEITVYPLSGAPAKSEEQKPRWKLRQTSPAGDYTLPVPFLYFLELMLDVCMVSLVWTLAHLIRFQDMAGPFASSEFMQKSVIPRLPELIIIKLTCFSVFKLYRGVWRSLSVQDIYSVFKAVTLASVVLVVGSALKTRMADLSRLVIILDWSMTFIALLSIRGAMSLFRRWSLKLATAPYKAAVIGDMGLLRLIQTALPANRSIELSGLILEDQSSAIESKDGDTALILGNIGNLESILKEKSLDVLYVLGENGKNNSEIALIAAKKGVLVRQVRIDLG